MRFNCFLLLSSFCFFCSCNPAQKSVEKNDVTTMDSLFSTNGFAPNDTVGLDFFAKKFRTGIDFHSTGNEPFWGLEIDFDKAMEFSAMGELPIRFEPPFTTTPSGANAVQYQAQSAQGMLKVLLQKQTCVNDMSGIASDYSVTVSVKNNTDTGFKVYKGCGRYLSDYRLNDIWVLESMNQKKLNARDFAKGLPMLEFTLADGKMMGHTGCNQLNGRVEVQGKSIKTGGIATTRMACPNSTFESKYLLALSNKTMPYSIKEGRLYVRVAADSIFTYKKVD